jgi:hypothetical protein
MKKTIIIYFCLTIFLYSQTNSNETNVIFSDDFCYTVLNKKNNTLYKQTYYKKSRKIMQEVPIIDGKANGLLTFWREDGSIRNYIVFIDDVPRGIYDLNTNGTLNRIREYTKKWECILDAKIKEDQTFQSIKDSNPTQTSSTHTRNPGD